MSCAVMSIRIIHHLLTVGNEYAHINWDVDPPWTKLQLGHPSYGGDAPGSADNINLRRARKGGTRKLAVI